MKRNFKLLKINISYYRIFAIALISLNLGILSGCKKFVQVDDLKDQMLSKNVFNDETSANAAILSIYNTFKSSTISGTINGLSSLLCDDATFQYAVPVYKDYETNTVSSNNIQLPWRGLYEGIYKANSAIEGLQASTTIAENKKSQLVAEAKFWRAYGYFNLINFFGDVPLLTSTNVEKNAIAPRNNSTEVYMQIVKDLLDAQAALPTDYSLSGGRRVRLNKWAVTAMLARVYLYQKNWSESEKQSTAVIESGSYTLLEDINSIFTISNQESILQLDRFSDESFILSDYLIPASATSTPYIVCTPTLINAFETSDKRKMSWLFPLTYIGQQYYAAFKFRTKNTSTILELETPLRLSEQYLIRAEARAMQNDFANAIADINIIRLKHGGLTVGLPIPTDQQRAMDVIMHERRVELFTEEAHRWFDLKRTGNLNAVMQDTKSTTWTNDAVLLPIPIIDVQRNPNLNQNPGYQ